MKLLKTSLLAALAVALIAGDVHAQRKKREGGRRRGGEAGQPGQPGQPGRGGRGGRGGFGGRFRPPPNLLVEALDTNKDGTISADELKNAAKSLAALDKNKDGKLTADELGPPRGFGPGGRGGFGRGGRGGFGRGGAGGAGGRGGAGGPGSFIDRMFKDRDKNKDGKLDKAELGERGASLIQRADTNKDGAVSKEELQKMFSSGRGGRGGRGGGFGRGRGGRGGEGGGRPQRKKRPDTE